MNPERPWPALDRLRDATEAAGKVLAPRLTIYPEYVRDPSEWIDPELRTAVLVRSDSEGLARDTEWSPGRDDLAPAHAAPAAGARRAPVARSAKCSTACVAGEEVGVDEIVTLARRARSRSHRDRRGRRRNCGARSSATK